MKISSLVSSVDETIFPVTSRKVSIILSGAIVVLLSLLIFSVRQNILTYDNTLETLYFVLTVTIAWGIGSWFLLGYVKRATAPYSANAGAFLSILRLAVIVAQFSLLAIMLFVIFDRSSEYLMSYVNGITSCFAIIIMGAIAYKLLKWYGRSNRRFIVLLYFLTAATVAIMIASDFAVKFMVTYRVEASIPGEISREQVLYQDTSEGELIRKDIEPDYTLSYIVPMVFLPAWSFLNNYPGLISLFTRWGATAYTLNVFNLEHRRMKNVVFWTLIILPLVFYFVGKSPDLLGINPEPWTRPLFRGGNIAMGVLFGVAFLVMARKVPAVKDYLTFAAIGIMIITVAFSISNLQQTFGIAGHSLILLSSYLFAIGLYYCAISVSHDAVLRSEIRHSAQRASVDLVESAGTAEMYEELEQTVLKISKEQANMLVSETGVRPSLEEDDVKQYLEKVVLPEVLEKKGSQSVNML